MVTSHTVLSFNRVHDARELLVWYGIAWGIFVMAVAIIHFVPFRTAIVIIVLGGLALGLVSLLKPPQTSTDSARYAWDGIVAKSGRSPYNYVPSDSKLTQLRPDWLFPAVLHPEGNYPNAPLRCP
ncbi:MAG: hypothetical protein ACREN8_07520, partial [Candidatus Dormibacteraceae bacterium]